MSVLEKLLNERNEILCKFDKLDELKRQVETIENELSIFGTKEDILKDIKELNDLIELQNNTSRIQVEFSTLAEPNEQPIEEEYLTDTENYLENETNSEDLN